MTPQEAFKVWYLGNNGDGSGVTIDSALLASVLAQRRSMPTIPPGAHKRAYLDKIAQQLRKEHKQEHEVPAAEALGESTFGLSQRSTAKVVPEPVDGASQ